jgi:hypothetical protein
MGTITTILLTGVVLVGGYLVLKHVTKTVGQNFSEGLKTPEGQKGLKQFEEELHSLETPPPPPKAVSHAHLGRFVSYG